MAKVSVANNVTRSNRKWIIGYSIAGFLLFITYQFLIPWDGLPSGIYQVVNQWMPPSAVNESLVYVIMALGLNIVVDLPAPFEPIKVTISPSLTVTETSLTAMILPPSHS